LVAFRLPKDDIARLDRWAKTNGYTRSQAMRVLMERGIVATAAARRT
jgi:predicted DNA-binding protein